MIQITATMNRNHDPDIFDHEKAAYFALKDAAQFARVPFAEATEDDGLPPGYLGISVFCGWPGMFASMMAALVEKEGDTFRDCYGIGDADPIGILCIGDYAPFFYNLDDFREE